MTTITGTVTNEATCYIAVKVKSTSAPLKVGDRVDATLDHHNHQPAFDNKIVEVADYGSGVYVYFNKITQGFK